MAGVVAAVVLVAVRPRPDRAVLVSLAGLAGGRHPGELGGGAGVPGRVQLWGRCRACGGVQSFGGGAGCGGLGGVPLRFAEFGDGFGERGQPGDERMVSAA